MYEQQTTRNRPAWAKGRGGRFGGIGGTFVGNKITDMMAPELLKIPKVANNPAAVRRITDYINRNKERGTPSSAVRTTAPKLYL